jgi:hypothetical protein
MQMATTVSVELPEILIRPLFRPLPEPGFGATKNTLSEPRSPFSTGAGE